MESVPALCWVWRDSLGLWGRVWGWTEKRAAGNEMAMAGGGRQRKSEGGQRPSL